MPVLKNSPKKFFLGIDLGGSQIKFGIVSSSGEILTEGKISSFVDYGRKKILENLVTVIKNLLTEAAKRKIKISGIGIGTPGTVDQKTGRVVGACPNIPGWVGVNLKQFLQKKFKIPVFVDNDANLMTLAENRLGAGKGYKDVLGLTIGTGIGGGIVLGGKLFRGKNFAAGEIGHTIVVSNGLKCKCGSRGCLEAYAAAPAMVRGARSSIGENNSLLKKLAGGKTDRITPGIIFEASSRNDRLARNIVKEATDFLSSGVASAVNLLNPEVVILGGGILDLKSNFLKETRRKALQKAFPSTTKNLKIVKAALGNKAGFLGAALLASESL